MRAIRWTAIAIVAAFMTVGPLWAAAPASPENAPTVGNRESVPSTSLGRSGSSGDFQTAMAMGAAYLRAMEADITDDNAGNGTDGVDETPDDPDDGGWDWSVASPPNPVFHTITASSPNLFGVTALGMYYAYLESGDPALLTAMTDCANGILANPAVAYGPDFIFLCKYDALPGVPGTTYQDLAKSRYDAKILAKGGADSLAIAIRDGRNGQGYPNGIIPWDVSAYALAATELDAIFGGYAADATAMAEIVWQDSFNANPGYFDPVADAGWDPTYTDKNFWWYTLGISGLIDCFQASGTHLAEIPWLVGQIQGSQYASGAISGSYGANAGDEDWQSTAYCVMTLGMVDPTAYFSEIDGGGQWICATQDTALTGGWRYSSNNHYPEIGGENTAALYFAASGVSTVAPVDPGSCISVANTCITVDMDITRPVTPDMRGFSVDIQLTGLNLCGAGIVEGTYLDAISGTNFQVVDNGSGSYTVDCAILGIPCGQSAATGTLFTLDVESAGVDGTGTIAVTSVTLRDCANGAIPGAPGADLDLTIDTVPPVAVTDIASVQVKTGNDSDGTTMVTVNFGAPGDAATVEVYRAPYVDGTNANAYPEYDDLAGAGAPALPSYPPGAPWASTAVVATGQNDETGARGFWYYTVFTKDTCGNVSAVSNMSGGSLNYHLGDVSDGTITPGAGNNVVDIGDISDLGANYGITLAPADPVNYLDVGPTTDWSVDALPTTDDAVGFEDLMMFAINFGQVSAPNASRGRPVASMIPSLDMLVGQVSASGVMTVRLDLENNADLVKGVHSVLTWDESRLELLGATRGQLLDSQPGSVFFKDLPAAGEIVVDAAILGRTSVLSGSGNVAELSFRVLSEGAVPHLATAELRNLSNRPAGTRMDVASDIGRTSDGQLAGSQLPVRFELVGARPNPFGRSTEIVFRLPETAPVSVRIYDVAGRMVRTLVDRTVPAGETRAVWNGQTDEGLKAGSGIYFYRIQTGDLLETRKVVRFR